jgi:hypothetical protein
VDADEGGKLKIAALFSAARLGVTNPASVHVEISITNRMELNKRILAWVLVLGDHGRS